MNTFFKKMMRIKLLGLIIWIIPFVASFFLWDPVAGGPSIPQEWFNSIMWLAMAVGFTIAVMKLFRGEKQKTAQKTAMLAGFTWFVQLSALDLIFLVLIFGQTLAMWYTLVVMYLGFWLMTLGVGAIVAKR